MAYGWQKYDFGGGWKGLLSRRGDIDMDPMYAATCRNIDFFGSVIGKREGTQLLNGWGTTVETAWVDPTAPISSGLFVGDVADSSGFRIGDIVWLRTQQGGIGAARVYLISGATMTVQAITGTEPFQPLNPLPGDSLVTFRRRGSWLTVGSDWTNTTTGTVVVADIWNVRPGDHIVRVALSGGHLGIYSESIVQTVNVATGGITVSPAFSAKPLAGDTLVVRPGAYATGALAGWTTTSGTILGDTTLLAGVMLPGQTVIFLDFITGIAYTSIIVSMVGSTLTVSPALGYTPGGGDLIFTYPSKRMDGLCQATSRTGTRRTIFAGDDLLAVLGNGSISVPTQQFPATTVNGTWGGTSSGKLATLQGLDIGDAITIDGAGAGGLPLQTTVTLINGTPTPGPSDYNPANSITISPVASSAPVNGARVTLMPARTGADVTFTQLADLTHVAGAARVGTQPPTKLTDIGGTFVEQRHGIKAPKTKTTVTLHGSGTGPNTGKHTWRVKFRCSLTGAESEPSPIPDFTAAPASPTTDVLSAVGQQVDLSGIPVSPDPQVDQRVIYRTLADADGAWYYVGTIADNTTTTFADTVIDSALGDLMREFLDYPAPTTLSVVTTWPGADRLIGIDAAQNSLVYSDGPDVVSGFLKPESWPPDNMLFVNYDDGDLLVGIAPLFDSLLIFKERSVWRITGIPPNLTLEPVLFRADLTGAGALSHKAIFTDENEVIFWSQDGMYVVSRYVGVQSGFQSDRVTQPIDAEVDRITVTNRHTAHGVYFRRRRQIRSFLPVDARPDPSEGFVFQMDASITGQPHGWSLWNITGLLEEARLTASCIVQTSTNDLMYVGTDSCDLLHMDTGSGSDMGGFGYPVQYTTVAFAPAGAGMPARGRALDLTIQPIVSTNLNVGVFIDQAPTPLTAVAVHAMGGFQLDVTPFDDPRYVLEGAQSTQFEGVTLLAVGQFHQIDLEEFSTTGLFRIKTMCYWFQALPPQAKTRSIVQVR